MTVYQRKLEEMVRRCSPRTAPEALIDTLFRLGVIDHTLMKVLVVREYVKDRVKNGSSRLSAMWHATEEFACSYEYVRKCVYYYKDVNFHPPVAENV